jgi:hypothetical protein
MQGMYVKIAKRDVPSSVNLTMSRGLQSPVDTADHLATDSTPKCDLSPNNVVCVLCRRFHTSRYDAVSLDVYLPAFRKNRLRLRRENPESDTFRSCY